jgi:altronate hydrolase
MATPRTIRLNPQDNVAIAVDLVRQGDTAPASRRANESSRATRWRWSRSARASRSEKFGQIIGFAKAHIAPGDGCTSTMSACTISPATTASPRIARRRRAAARASDLRGLSPPVGRTGTRNYIGILTSVNCSASVARFAAAAVEKSGLLADHPGIDGIVPIVHGTGCGHAAYGEGFEVLRRTQWGYASHPNFAAVVMVGLGCEVFQIGRMKKEYGLEESDTFRTLTIQETGGTRKTVAAIEATIRDMIPLAARARRETRPASELVLALQCGGSDGYSALTANPALGAASDLLVRHGGASILSETPEIYGAEHLLTRRAATREVGEKLVSRIKWWEEYTAKNGGEMNNNPSPGNKAGGLTTILEKSLGAIAKGGQSTLRAVYEYAELVREKGFVYMDTPGYDPVAATGQVAGGANLICFTTGRGSAFGAKPAPSIKLATNSDIFAKMEDDMDIDCGDILEGVSIEQKGERSSPRCWPWRPASTRSRKTWAMAI